MKCDVCQQSNFVSLHGRLFCGGCGGNAAQRLGNFRTQPSNVPAARIGETKQPPQPDRSNTLDLSQYGSNSKETNTSARTVAGAAVRKSPQAAGQPRSMDLGSQRTEQNTAAAQASTPEAATPMRPQATYVLKDGHDLQREHRSRQPETTNVQQVGRSRGFRPRLPKLSMPQVMNFAWMRLATVTAGMLLLVGYVTYLNYPTIAVRVAASRANIDASIPGYVPSGYKYSGPIKYDTGSLVLTFSSSEGTIALTQSNTRWDSESLLDNLIRQRTSKYSTYQENGLTIYTYDNRHAAWVNGGLLYQIETSDHLSPEDLVRIASSL